MSAVATPAGELSPVARHIARAAARLFAERGYDATSVREIVEAAGVAKPTMYYYFRSKEGPGPGLVDGSSDEPGRRTCARIVTTVEPPVRCLEQVIEAQYAFCRDDPDRGRFIYALLFGPLGSEIAGELEPFKESLRSWTDSAVRRLVEVGIVDRDRRRCLCDRLSRADCHLHA